MKIEYRIATKQDMNYLVEIRLEMLKKVNDLKEDYEFSDEFIKSTRLYFSEGNQSTILAYDGTCAIGCATMSYIYIMPTFSHPSGRRAHLMNVYTNEKYRRQGIAKKMVQMLIDEAKKRGTTEVSLDATDLGRSLYENMGFVASSECMVLNLN